MSSIQTKYVNDSRSRQLSKTFLKYDKKFLVFENFIILLSCIQIKCVELCQSPTLCLRHYVPITRWNNSPFAACTWTVDVISVSHPPCTPHLPPHCTFSSHCLLPNWYVAIIHLISLCVMHNSVLALYVVIVTQCLLVSLMCVSCTNDGSAWSTRTARSMDLLLAQASVDRATIDQKHSTIYG